MLVTRPAAEAARWVHDLQARGIAAAALPLIAITGCTRPAAVAALAQARAHWAQYRAVMFVSGNAVQHFFESNHPPALEPSALAASKTRAWAPGPGTVRALQSAGMPPALIDAPAADAAQFDSEALWQRVQPQVRPGDAVLIVRGASDGQAGATDGAGNGRDWLAAQIAAAGGSVTFVAAYERGAPRFDAAQQALARSAATDGTLWLLSSSEAVAHLAAALPDQDWRAARALATHPRIAEAVRALGFGHVAPCRPALDDVVASIESRP